MYDLVMGKVFVSHDVIFREHIFSFTSSVVDSTLVLPTSQEILSDDHPYSHIIGTTQAPNSDNNIEIA